MNKWVVLIVVFIILAIILQTLTVGAEEAPEQCGAWSGTPAEMRYKGCVPLIDNVWVVGASLCEYTAYVLSTWRDYLFNQFKVTETDEYHEKLIEKYGCTFDDRWVVA